MDYLAEIVQTFSKDDAASFAFFVHRQKQKKDRKDLELFRLLQARPDIKPLEAQLKLYPHGNKEAYQQLRKKLHKHITDFLVLKRIDNDTTSVSQIMGNISLARYLFEHQSEKLAWKYLEKAIVLAKKNEQYEQLNTIYTIHIEHSESAFAPDLQEILENHKRNKELVEQNERANIAYSIIKQQLRKVKLIGTSINFDYVVSSTLESQGLSFAFYKRPRIFFQVMNIFRSAIVAKKDYYSFEPFLIENYTRFNVTTGFAPQHTEYKVNLLYMIAHTLYRNKKFNDSLRYLEDLIEAAKGMSRAFVLKHYPRYITLYSANHFFTANSAQAIQVLEDCLVDEEVKLEIHEQANILLNLSFYYVYQNSYKEANKRLLQIFHSNAWCEKNLGKEWVLKKDLVEIIIQYELGNVDIALNRIRTIERKNDIIQIEPYTRVATYLKLIKKLIDAPQEVSSESFIQYVEESFDWVPMEQEDLQAVMYYAWFKSKMVRRDMYSVLLDLVNNVS